MLANLISLLWVQELNIGVSHISYRLLANLSLKGKRQVMTSLLSRIHQKFNVSVAEYGDYDLWQRITIITCIASADPDFPNQLLERIVSFVAEIRPDLELIDCSTELIAGI